MAVDWFADVRIYDADANEDVVNKIANYCGIALQSRDGQLVAMADTKECETVRENFLKKKLGLTNSDAELDEAIQSVREIMKADQTKNRVTVYYLLTRHFESLNIFGGIAGGTAAMGAISVAGAAVSDMASTPLNAMRSGFDDDDANGGWGWLKWLLLAALLAVLLFFLLRSCASQEATPAAVPDTAGR